MRRQPRHLWRHTQGEKHLLFASALLLTVEERGDTATKAQVQRLLSDDVDVGLTAEEQERWVRLDAAQLAKGPMIAGRRVQ